MKKPFYEVISGTLATLVCDINGALLGSHEWADRRAKLEAFLHILQESEMPAAAAHEIAKRHSGLGDRLRERGPLAHLVVSVLADLQQRDD